MQIFITGGTGFIGRHITRMLTDNGHSVVVATRNPSAQKRSIGFILSEKPDHIGGGKKIQDNSPPDSPGSVKYVQFRKDMRDDINGCEVVINLAGENLFGKRWTQRVKRKLYNSRVQTTRELVSSMKNCNPKPKLFLSASAVGYYGECGSEQVTESREAGDDFLARVCLDWERASGDAETAGIRVVNPRFGVALGTDGGALAIMIPVFKSYLGGSIGPGNQYFPWIHIEDLCRSLLFAIQNEEMSGPFNATAPNPVSMDTYSKVLGSTLSRPSFFKIPEWSINLALGEAASMMTTSQWVLPDKLEKQGFTFKYENIKDALTHLLKS